MNRPTTVFLLLAFALTWGVWVPRALAGDDPGWTGALAPLSTYGPAAAAVLTAALTGGRPALRALGRRLVRWRVGRQWWLLVLAGPVGVWLTAAGAHLAATGELGAAPQVLDAGPLGVLALLPLLLLTDGLGEEVGWRGFALPEWLRDAGPATASLLLGVVWAVWHAPLAWTDGATLEGTAIWLLLLQLPALAVLHTWVFRGTGGSALTAVVLHATTSLFAVPLPGGGEPWPPYLLQLAVQVALAAAVLAGWRRVRPVRPVPRQRAVADWRG
ncbi:CPBP family intramembrane glutamic endopeptidase [Modestobacter versicolor]|uniref:CPBP family intramembrane glutamic endopeptidase n=1 Tax=Modestobacter versicolor TaxID=429133 RepID=UPI0034DF3305